MTYFGTAEVEEPSCFALFADDASAASVDADVFAALGTTEPLVFDFRLSASI